MSAWRIGARYDWLDGGSVDYGANSAFLANPSFYQSREQDFTRRWSAAVADWERQAGPLKGVPVVVQHKAFTYLVAWLGLKQVATLAPKPGVEPTTARLSQVLATLAGWMDIGRHRVHVGIGRFHLSGLAARPHDRLDHGRSRSNN